MNASRLRTEPTGFVRAYDPCTKFTPEIVMDMHESSPTLTGTLTVPVSVDDLRELHHQLKNLDPHCLWKYAAAAFGIIEKALNPKPTGSYANENDKPRTVRPLDAPLCGEQFRTTNGEALQEQSASVRAGLQAIPKREHSHYFKDVSNLHEVDVYRVLELFEVTNPSIAHAVKKLLVAGGRGAGKDIGKDIKEAIDSLVRWQAMRHEDARS